MGTPRALELNHARRDPGGVGSVDEFIAGEGFPYSLLHRLAWPAAVAFCAVFPALVLVALFVAAIQDNGVAMDFGQFYRAAVAIREGDSPYPAAGEPLTWWGGPYPYPPLPALVAIPLTALPPQAAGLLVMALLVAAAIASLFILGVRDWRCYGLMVLWPPVISAIQTANLSLWFTLVLAIAWRFRDRAAPVAASIGVTLAAKFFLWPLVVWLAASRRFLAASFAAVIGAGLFLLSWAAIGFADIRSYPSLLHRVEEIVGIVRTRRTSSASTWDCQCPLHALFG